MYGLSFLITYILLITSISFKQYDLKEGDIARTDIKAPRDTINEVATKDKEDEAAKGVEKKYTLNTSIEESAKSYIEGFFNKIINIKSSDKNTEDKVNELKKLSDYNLSEDELKVLLNLSSEELDSLKYDLNGVIIDVYRKNIPDDNEESLAQAKNLAEEKIGYLNTSNKVKDVLKKVILPQIKPNFYLDVGATDQAIKDAKKNVQKVIIKKNQTIVSEGEPITGEQLSVLEDLGLLDKSSGREFFIMYVVLAVFVVLVFVLQNVYIAKNHKETYKDTKMMILINTVSIISFILSRVIGALSPFAIPLTSAPILLSLLIDYRLSMVICSLNVLVISALVNFNPQVMLLALLSAILGSTSLKKMQQRNDIMRLSVSITIFSTVLTFTTGVLISNNLSEVLSISLISGVGVIFSAILAIGFLPFLESTFDVVTSLKLLELSNPNNPLLKKLLMEAPGTYHHSMLVANLAEMAAEEVNANPVIARIGAYFHDIGKTKRPYFFGENQIGRENPHNNITPNLSTLIITSHVKDGVELAKEYNMPKVIKDIIEQHHGTTLVKYFYYTLKNNSENPDEIKEEDFRYPGPIPSSKEAGIIMIADSVEAAVRSISDPTKGKIEEMVNNIIKDKLYSGQLDDCDLTLKDLEKIRKCFLKTLNGIYHQRVEYPTEKKIKSAN
ncbi:HDIG domain-containing protein [Clostridium sp. LY3-2]|nr:HDIG domain-containing metalloprotein [Clostridium sp. LY3-2]MCR6513492.1 HDIG domain-containing protein [Clostridium sp. LY3-2]